MISLVLKATNHCVVSTLILILIGLLPSEAAVAQESSAYSASQDIYLEPDFPGAPWPVWMLEPPDYLHGVGVAKFSRYDTLASFRDAFEFGIQELNANAFMIASVKAGDSPSTGAFVWTEFAIGEDYSKKNSYRIDSAIVGKRCFMLVSTRPRPETSHELKIIPDQSEWSTWLNPKEEAGIWYFKGQHKIFSYSKNESWTLAKQDAIKRFTEFLNTDVMAGQKIYSDKYYESFKEIYYLESRLFFRDIQIEGRWADGKNYYVLLKIPNTRIKAIETGEL